MDTMKSTSLWTASLGALLLLNACYTVPNINGGSESSPPDVTGMSLSVTNAANMTSLRISGLLSASNSPGVLHIEGDNLNGWSYRLCGASTPLPFKGTASSSTVELEVNLADLTSVSQNNTACILPVRSDGLLGEPRLVPWKSDDPVAFSIETPVSRNPLKLRLVPKYFGAQRIIYADTANTIKFDMDATPFVTVSGNEKIQDMTLADIDRDRVPDLVILTTEPVPPSGTSAYKLKAYYLKGKVDNSGRPDGSFDNNIVNAIPMMTGPVMGDPQCQNSNVSARMAVLDLDENNKVDITAQWYCPGGGWSSVYTARQ